VRSGKHKLPLFLADLDHIPHDPPKDSERITITIRKAPRQRPSRPDVQLERQPRLTP
jgi:hypothetical protein